METYKHIYKGALQKKPTQEIYAYQPTKWRLTQHIYKRDQQKRPTEEIYAYQPTKWRLTKHIYERDLYISKERPTNETLIDGILPKRLERDLQKKPNISKETYIYIKRETHK